MMYTYVCREGEGEGEGIYMRSYNALALSWRSEAKDSGKHTHTHRYAPTQQPPKTGQGSYQRERETYQQLPTAGDRERSGEMVLLGEGPRWRRAPRGEAQEEEEGAGVVCVCLCAAINAGTKKARTHIHTHTEKRFLNGIRAV